MELQASEQEIAQALKEKHMLIIDGEHPSPPSRVYSQADEYMCSLLTRP